MKVLITGAAGFTGVELIKYLSDDLVLVDKDIELLNHHKGEAIKCDLLNVEEVNNIIKQHKPENIFHLAGSFTNDYSVDYNINVLSTKNVLDAIWENSPLSRVLLVGSAAEYGTVSAAQCPIAETHPLSPYNIYGLSKIFQKTLMDYYVNVFSMNILMARPFNLYGPGLSPKLFVGKVYEEIKRYKEGKSKYIHLGNLSSKRDYLPVEDAVKHYIQIMNYGIKGGVYNVGQGIATKIEEILKKILLSESIDFSVVRADNIRAQKNDSDIIYADISKLEALYNE